MYLSVYLDKNSLWATDFIVFHVSDESLFFEFSYLPGEEKCSHGCTVISSVKREKERGSKESDYSTWLWKSTICSTFTSVVWHLINMSKNILVIISHVPSGYLPTSLECSHQLPPLPSLLHWLWGHEERSMANLSCRLEEHYKTHCSRGLYAKQGGDRACLCWLTLDLCFPPAHSPARPTQPSQRASMFCSSLRKAEKRNNTQKTWKPTFV